ncbi:MAG TPA: FAD binding domain-containing protein [Bdellovibrionales bacterium]|nr:FAD binding domain-containing protein [Bdellovibrionales bacterium]
MRKNIIFYVNGEKHEVGDHRAGWMLADYLRYERGLTGTKIVCAEGDCGACSVLRWHPYPSKTGAPRFLPVNSCIATVAQLDGSSLVTVEGLGRPDSLAPAQARMLEKHGSQCGFCTPGFVVAIAGLVEKKLCARDEHPITEKEARNGLTGNLCRCTGYQQILEAATSVPLKQCQPAAERFLSARLAKELRAAVKEPVLITAPELEFYAPVTLKDAAQYLVENKDARVLAAATDLGVVHNKGRIRLSRVLSLHLVPELYELAWNKSTLRVGARVTLARLRTALKEKAPEFSRFLDIFASPQIKNVATLAGNVANASPIADTPPFLMISDAVVEAFGPKGMRRIPIDAFFTGYRQTALMPGEVIRAIELTPPRAGERWSVRKVSERKDLDISSVNAAFRLGRQARGELRDVRLAMGGVAATTLRLRKTESVLEGRVLTPETIERALETLRDEIKPISDVRGSDAFRQTLARNLLRRFLMEARA